MTRKRRKNKAERRKVRNTSGAALPDLSLKDFADAAEPKERSQKILIGSIKPQPRDYSSRQAQDDPDLLWYERDDFDTDEPAEHVDDDGEKNELLNEAPKGQKKTRRANAKLSTSYSGEYVYPDDVWFLLSAFIRPEDVLRFSLICKGAFTAVSSSRFWLRMYNIFVQDSEKLPVNLRSDRIDCRPGLRARVVRALFYNCDVFKSRLVTKVWDSSRMDALLYWTCSLMWFRQTTTRKDTKIWMFYFKFRQNASNVKPERFSKAWIESADFVRDNPEEGYPVLAVSCLNFISFRPVLGMVLSEVLVGISQNMKHCRVKLMFHNQRMRDRKYRPESGYQVVLDPAQDVNVLHWWHPLYPHPEF